MRKFIIKFRGFRVTKRELIADLIFLIVSFLVSLGLLFIFDMHWSLYPGQTIFPPSKYVGLSGQAYLTGSLIGAIFGFFAIKILLLGIKEELKEK
jgi:hypothetical protein